MATNRVYLTLKNEIRLYLEDWADQQGRPLASMANWLVEQAIKEAIASGQFHPRHRAIADSTESRAIAFIQAVASGGTIGILDVQKLADDLAIPSDRLAQILKSAKGKIINGKH